MREVKKTYRVYNFEELSEKAQEKALEAFRDINVDDYYWSEPRIWEAKDKLIEQGFLEPEIQFSGFWSQGDGASFTAKVDVQKFLSGQTKEIQEKFKPLHNILTGEAEENDDYLEIKYFIERNGSHYVHEMSCRVNSETFGSRQYTKEELDLMNELEELIERERVRLCKEIYKDLESTYEELTSPQCIRETIDANEYEFNEDGSQFTE